MNVLRKILGRNRIWVFLAVFAAIFSNGVQIIYTHQVGNLVNKIVDRESISPFLVFILAVFIIVQALSVYAKYVIGHYASERASHSLRMGFMRYLLQNRPGETISPISEDQAMSIVQGELSLCMDYLNNSFFEIIGNLIACFLVTVFLFFENVLLTIALLVPTFLILLYVSLSGTKIARYTQKTLAAKARMNRTAFSIAKNFPAISVYDAGAFLDEKYEQDLSEWEKRFKKEDRMYAVLNSISGLISKVPLLFVFFCGAYLIFRGDMTLGTLIVFLNLQNSVTMVLMNTPIFIARFKTFTTNLSKVNIV